ncbi:hypothetical protein LTR37_007328 [Vermiconidia calcicola]|uniref:Uncharacterized protein n=1 Tax=Vermiconidia calcicola TaxID=1690605 RepID=A0ACC3NGL9_9PEZI|nr:hypothetical protein LTR37_007328 [Vermiconidia calcicola]
MAGLPREAVKSHQAAITTTKSTHEAQERLNVDRDSSTNEAITDTRSSHQRSLEQGATSTVTSALDQATENFDDLGPGDQGSVSPQEPMANFPLPRELRDEIYSYLLDARNVEYTPLPEQDTKHSEAYSLRSGRAHTYDFCTALLRVNKTLGDEAKQQLYSKSAFVKIDFDMPGFHQLLHLANVPVLAEANIEHFPHFALKVDLLWKTPPWVKLCEYLHELTPSHDRGSVLMLTQDFRRFCEMLKYQCQFTSPRCVYVNTSAGLEVKPVVVEVSEPPTIKVTCRTTVLTALSDQHQAALLNDLRTVTGAGYKLTISGFADHALSRAVKESMSPRIIWVRAMEWDRLELGLLKKREADKLALLHDIRGATHRYNLLMDYWYAPHAGVTKLIPRDGFDRARGAAYLRWSYFLFDLCMSRATPNMRVGGNLKMASDDTAELQRLELSRFCPENMVLQELHGSFLANVFLLNEKDEHPRNTDIHGVILRYLTEIRGHPGYASRGQIITHDVSIMQALLPQIENMETESAIRKIVAQLSPRALPWQPFDSQGECQQAIRPACLVEWQDTQHLANLSFEDKQTIKEVQRANGFRESKF